MKQSAKAFEFFVGEVVPLTEEDEEGGESILQATLKLIVQVLGADEFSIEDYEEQVNEENLATLDMMIEANLVEDMGGGLFKIKDRCVCDL